MATEREALVPLEEARRGTIDNFLIPLVQASVRDKTEVRDGIIFNHADLEGFQKICNILFNRETAVLVYLQTTTMTSVYTSHDIVSDVLVQVTAKNCKLTVHDVHVLACFGTKVETEWERKVRKEAEEARLRIIFAYQNSAATPEERLALIGLRVKTPYSRMAGGILN